MLFQSNIYSPNYSNDIVVFNLFKRQTINLFPNFNLTFSKTLKKNSILFTPGIRSITAKLKPTNSTVSGVFFGVNSSDSYLFKELKITQLYIDLPIIYNIKLNDIFSINLGLSVNLPFSANFFGNYNSIIIQTNNENLVQKAHYNSVNATPLIIGDTINYLGLWGTGLDNFILPNNFNIDDLNGGDKLTSMHIQGSPINLNFMTTIIGGVDFSFNKKNKINLNYRLSTSRSKYMITNFLIKEEWFWNPTTFVPYKDWRLESKYFESKSFLLQFLEINYIHLF